MSLEQQIKIAAKSVLVSLQQKLDLTAASFPSSRTLASWFAVVAAGILLSAAANMAIIKFALFPQIKVGQQTAVSGEAEMAALVLVVERPKSDDFKNILKRNVFNSEQADEVVKDPAAGTSQCKPVKSDLPLKFTGVIFGGTKETSLVLLESQSTKDTDTFLYNDEIPGEARIVDIQKDTVFFLRGDSNCPEFLELQQPEVAKRRVPNAARARPSNNSNAGGAGIYEYSEPGFTRSKEGIISADRRFVDNALTKDFAKTLQDAKANPNLVNGEVKGFMLTRIRPNSVYEKMGFQDGDVIESINGIDLNDAARAIQTLNNLRQESLIELMVKRNGVTIPKKIQVK